MKIIIRKMEEKDYPRVSQIYEQGIRSKKCTFETEVPTWEAFSQSHCEQCRLVVCDEVGYILGFAALSPMSLRACFNGVAEISIYMDNCCVGKGIGTRLLNTLIKQSEEAGYWSLFSGIFEENIASIQLHERCGFRKIGYRERVGKTSEGQFKDVIYYEKRSQSVGV